VILGRRARASALDMVAMRSRVDLVVGGKSSEGWRVKKASREDIVAGGVGVGLGR